MTAADRTRFSTAFHALTLGLELYGDAPEREIVYFEALTDLPIEAIETASRQFLKEPNRRKFPTTGEWYAAADELAFRMLQEAQEDRRALPLERLAGRTARMARIAVARAAFLEKMRVYSPAAADHFDANVPMRDPDEYPRPYACPTCEDRGWQSTAEARVSRCLCVPTNPVIAQQRAAHNRSRA